MTARISYCSACDRNVLILDGSAGAGDTGGAEAGSAGPVCREYGEKCSGEMCPILAVPPEQARQRLVRYRGGK